MEITLIQHFNCADVLSHNYKVANQGSFATSIRKVAPINILQRFIRIQSYIISLEPDSELISTVLTSSLLIVMGFTK